MAETPGAPLPPPPAPLPEPVVEKKRPWRLSPVWVVPILAVIVGASLLVNTLMQAGPTVTIEFRTAEGLEAGKTEVRYKEVVVGRVENVTLSSDRKRVLAGVRLVRSAAGIAVEDTYFWVVRPRIGTAGISGLGTLLSGSYIGVDAGTSDKPRDHYIGLETPPLVLRGEPGRRIDLRARDLGSLDVGSPVYYRRARVGRVVGYKLDPQNDELIVQIFIETPNEPLVTTTSRFWNASGLDLELTAGGVSLNAQTLTSVLIGGVAFEHLPGSDRQPAPEGTRFFLFSDRKRALAPPDGPPINMRMVFDHSVRGLAVGSPVDFLGVELGQVTALRLQYDAQRKRFPVEVTAHIYPLRLGSVRDAMLRNVPPSDRAANLRLLQTLVGNGLRAQMRTGNLLTGQQYVALDFIPKAQPAALAIDDGVAVVPTVPGTLSDLQPQLAEIVAKINKVPFDQIGRDLQTTLAQTRDALRQLSPEAQKALSQVDRTLRSVQESLSRMDRNLLDDSAPLQRNVEQTMLELQRAAQSLRTLGDYLQRHPEAILRGKQADPAVQSGEKPR
jgi:paraquat-inducible protein B